jgi:hypothetical protein
MLAASTAKEAGCVFAARKITETPREARSNQPPQQSNALSGCGHLNSRNPNNSAETPEATERLTSRARVWTIFFCGSETVSNFGLLFYFDKRLVKAIEVWDFFERSRHSNVYRSWQNQRCTVLSIVSCGSLYSGRSAPPFSAIVASERIRGST